MNPFDAAHILRRTRRPACRCSSGR